MTAHSSEMKRGPDRSAKKCEPDSASVEDRCHLESRGEPVAAYVALGSNEGDRRRAMRAAVSAIAACPHIWVDQGDGIASENDVASESGIASLYETSPVGGPPGQRRFLNSALRMTTTLAPIELLRTLLDIESSLGRVRSRRWSARTIDIDLLLVGDQVVHGPELTLPHPRLHERRFVLAPLAEIAGDCLHPVMGVSIASLLAMCVADEGDCVRLEGPRWAQETLDPAHRV